LERTFLMVKPDGVQRNLTGEIFKRIEQKGFKLIGLKFMLIDEQLAAQHYAEHKDKPFFQELIDFITSGPVVAMVWEGDNIIATMRQLMGETNPADALPGTIRGDLAVSLSQNVIHGSDSPESAQREINLFFNEKELVSWDYLLNKWI